MKIRRYEVLEGMGHFVIREAGNSKASGLIALTCGLSKADEREAKRLVTQANAALELLEALKEAKIQLYKLGVVMGHVEAAIRKAEGQQ